MKSFRDFIEEKQPEVWHASKDEILQLWHNLRPVPLQMEPVPEHSKGTRLQFDGVRLTGSARFINSILSRLKDLISYESNPGTRLDIEYRQIETKVQTQESKYLFYLHVEQDTKKKNKVAQQAQKKIADTLDGGIETPKPLAPPEIGM